MPDEPSHVFDFNCAPNGGNTSLPRCSTVHDSSTSPSPSNPRYLLHFIPDGQSYYSVHPLFDHSFDQLVIQLFGQSKWDAICDYVYLIKKNKAKLVFLLTPFGNEKVGDVVEFFNRNLYFNVLSPMQDKDIIFYSFDNSYARSPGCSVFMSSPTSSLEDTVGLQYNKAITDNKGSTFISIGRYFGNAHTENSDGAMLCFDFNEVTDEKRRLYKVFDQNGFCGEHSFHAGLTYFFVKNIIELLNAEDGADAVLSDEAVLSDLDDIPIPQLFWNYSFVDTFNKLYSTCTWDKVIKVINAIKKENNNVVFLLTPFGVNQGGEGSIFTHQTKLYGLFKAMKKQGIKAYIFDDRSGGEDGSRFSTDPPISSPDTVIKFHFRNTIMNNKGSRFIVIGQYFDYEFVKKFNILMMAVDFNKFTDENFQSLGMNNPEYMDKCHFLGSLAMAFTQGLFDMIREDSAPRLLYVPLSPPMKDHLRTYSDPPPVTAFSESKTDASLGDDMTPLVSRLDLHEQEF
jgi:hypothetical protein